MPSEMSAFDYPALAARIAAGSGAIRACLVVSDDGLSLGAHPADGDSRVREVWNALQRVGNPRRGFVEVGDELWAVARRGPYGAVVVASREEQPGILLDRMDAHLLEAERTQAFGDKPPAPAPGDKPQPEPIRRPRSPLHPEPRMTIMPDPQVSTRRAPLVSVAALETAAPEPNPRIDRVALSREFAKLLADGGS